MAAGGGEPIRSRRLVRGAPGILLCLTAACAGGRTSDEGGTAGSGGSGVPIAGGGNATGGVAGAGGARRLASA